MTGFFAHRRELVSPAAEAFVAALLPAARWVGGRSPVDVESNAGERIDVKVGFVQRIRTDRGIVDALGFMGSGRSVEAREAITHYALVVPPAEDVTVTTTSSHEVRMTMAAPDSWYLVPREDINEVFAPRLNAAGKPTGLNRYASLETSQQWRQTIP